MIGAVPLACLDVRRGLQNDRNLLLAAGAWGNHPKLNAVACFTDCQQFRVARLAGCDGCEGAVLRPGRHRGRG